MESTGSLSDEFFNRHSPCQFVDSAQLIGMPIWIKRDDLLHPVVSGNKFRKLKYPLRQIETEFQRTTKTPLIITMGGIWSNHLHATAHATAKLGLPSLGFVRGNEKMQSATLNDCRDQGMQFQFVDREIYRNLRENPSFWKTQLNPNLIEQYSIHHWLPEGGSTPEALHGVAEIIDELDFIPDVIIVACGTAATLAGLLAGLKGRSHVVGIAVLKNANYLRGEIARLLEQAGYPAYDNYDLLTNFHHGGYAKTTPELIQFCREFENQLEIPIEPIYTGKLFYALRELIKSGYFPSHKKIMALHTGGLQGVRGNPKLVGMY